MGKFLDRLVLCQHRRKGIREAKSNDGGKQVANRDPAYRILFQTKSKTRRWRPYHCRRRETRLWEELSLPLKSFSLSWRGSPWTLCNNSSDWLDISLFGSCTPQVDTTGSRIRLPTGTLSGPSFLGISFDHRVNKLVQHQHHPRALVVVPRLWLESNH